MKWSAAAPATLIHRFDDQAYAITLDAAGLYAVTSGTSGGKVWSMAKDGSAARELLAHPNLVQLIAVDSDSVYVASLIPPELLRVPKSGGRPITLAQDTIWGGIVADGQRVYWATWVTVGRVMRVDKNGGPTSVIGDGENGPTAGITLQANHVYWGNEGSGTICAATTPAGIPT